MAHAMAAIVVQQVLNRSISFLFAVQIIRTDNIYGTPCSLIYTFPIDGLWNIEHAGGTIIVLLVKWPAHRNS